MLELQRGVKPWWLAQRGTSLAAKGYMEARYGRDVPGRLARQPNKAAKRQWG